MGPIKKLMTVFKIKTLDILKHFAHHKTTYWKKKYHLGVCGLNLDSYIFEPQISKKYIFIFILRQLEQDISFMTRPLKAHITTTTTVLYRNSKEKIKMYFV